METKENMLDYVRRKLQSRAFNNAEAVRKTGISKATLSEIATGANGDPRYETVQKLYDYFQDVSK
jgi:hypothetical protein